MKKILKNIPSGKIENHIGKCLGWIVSQKNLLFENPISINHYCYLVYLLFYLDLSAGRVT